MKGLIMSLSKRFYEQQAERDAPAARLERARRNVRNALSAAQHELNRLHITLAMMDGKIS
jgi:ABC-type phosphate transport system auxiliary subunit